MKTVTVKACNASSTWTERGLFFAAYRKCSLRVIRGKLWMYDIESQEEYQFDIIISCSFFCVA